MVKSERSTGAVLPYRSASSLPVSSSIFGDIEATNVVKSDASLGGATVIDEEG
jgi:hypothetical protein